ncbi:hypothetical protein DVZ67_24150 [Salmonella enterica subsp. enterica serovar Saintpaul]|nr:hypothetical protein [Salmonella enterica]EBG0675868.1 hypothetical protein [Salmonella enterica subsp. enterica serovar Okatie]EBY2986050.1 hypothetical protein [Salmonella enterica subsp. enterica serovar Durban]ECC9158915.1 hypothetical protein [Salmonella enterica subsp. salamae]ECT1737225.1 hypothetical protein [Salmonella enterica subsp. enterica serovar Saintpaul]ECV3919430.1 hypothetical protein [Salmonella enterica subsp. enterica serovar O rough]EEG3130240.1 hypothetical protein 
MLSFFLCRTGTPCVTDSYPPPPLVTPTTAPGRNTRSSRYRYRSSRAVFSLSRINDAFVWLCRSRRRFPANADIWHLRFHWASERGRILKALHAGTYRFSPLSLVSRADGSQVAVWSSADALVIKCLSLYLENILPVSHRCEHLRGHGGGKASVQRTHSRLLSGRYPFVFRTDIRGYYAHISRPLLYDQLCRYVSCPVLRNLLSQFLHYSVEYGGEFHTPEKGIPRGSALSPLLAAFHLTETDEAFGQDRHVTYARYMDDFLILSPTRWHLRRAIRTLNQHFARSGFEQHPDKTFIGRVEKGFDWMGFWFTEKGGTSVAPRALENFRDRLRRLYERVRQMPADVRHRRMAGYVRSWTTWVPASLRANYSGRAVCRVIILHRQPYTMCQCIIYCFRRQLLFSRVIKYDPVRRMSVR